ncbi:MAG: hypothetical protein ACI81L_003502 [Verrucomicrobiales bacterium]|jgi:hypothetical protein
MGPLDESTPSVRVELSTDEFLAAPAAPEPGDPGNNKPGIPRSDGLRALHGTTDGPQRPGRSFLAPVAIAIAAIAVVGGILLLSVDRDPVAAPPDSTTPATIAPLPAPTNATRSEERQIIELDPHDLESIAAIGDEFVATARNRDELLWSLDGLSWEVDADPLRGVEAVGGVDGETRALVSRSNGEGGLIVETMAHRDGVWVVDSSRAPLEIERGDILETRIGKDSLVVVGDEWDRPVPEVSAVVAEYVSDDIAEATCAVRRNSNTGYEFLDCDGNELARLTPAAIEPGSFDDDRLSFAQEVLRKRSTIYLARPGEPSVKIELGPSVLVLDAATTNDGFVAFVLDPIDVLQNVDLLYSQAFTASLIRWDVESETITELPAPVRASAWSANRVVAQDDGSLLVVSPLGLHRASTPFTDWELISVGAFDPPRPSRVVNTALYGAGLFVPDPTFDGTMHMSCCGIDWESVDVGANFRRMLIVTDSVLVFDTLDRTIVSVRR